MFKLIKMFLIILAITGYSYVKAINNHIPIVFIHKNDSFYLKDVFSQAKKFKNNLILLGDDQNNKYDQVSHFKINNYLKSAKYFSKYYVHSSPNKFDFELFCFERWFILKDFMESKKINNCFYSDSDMKLYFNAQEDFDKYFNSYKAAILAPSYLSLTGHYDWVLHGGMISYWTLDGIKSFCNFIMNHFKNKHLGVHSWINNWEKNYWPECPLIDMLFFKKWYEANIDNSDIKNINDIFDDSTFDTSLFFDENQYEMQNNYMLEETKFGETFIEKIKNIKIINGLPYCYNIKLNKLIRFKSLHFQVSLKKMMFLY